MVVGIALEKLKRTLNISAGAFCNVYPCISTSYLAFLNFTFFCTEKFHKFELCSVSSCCKECIIHIQSNGSWQNK